MKDYLTSVNDLDKAITRSKPVIMDTETTGLNYMEDRPFLLSVKEIGEKAMAIRWDQELVNWLTHRLPQIPKTVWHNTKYDMHLMIQGGIDPRLIRSMPIPHCTFLTEMMLDEHKRAYNLDYLGFLYFQMHKISMGDKGDLINQPIQDVAKYAIRDVEITELLYERQLPLIKDQELTYLHDIEMRAARTLMFMERRGVPIASEEIVESASSKIMAEIDSLESKIENILGRSVNVNSQPQMLRAFDDLDIAIPINAKGKQSLAKPLIKNIQHPFVQNVLDLRSARKMEDTFIETIRKHSRNGRIHTNFNQLRDENFGTGTGRLSSSGPNLMQVPSPKRGNPEMAKIIRSLFAPPGGQVWGTGDWEQFEFRIFAHFTKEPFVIDAYNKDPTTDFHTMVAKLTGVRRNPDAKQINLGLIFGMGDGKLAETLGLPVVMKEMYGEMRAAPGPEAKAIFDKYHANFPTAKKFLKLASRIAKQRGYVKTIFKRRLRFPRGLYTHKAGGLVFQGSAADIMKKKLNEIEDALFTMNNGSEMILTVHDEFDFLASEEHKKMVSEAVNDIMVDCPELRVPILADVKTGPDWYMASK